MSRPADYTDRCRRISGTFYNAGLEKARIRDLTGACRCLKRSLSFDKYNTDARNLLGLIYYEIGETAEALVQWVLSINLRPEKNRAAYYIHEIQGSPGRLEDEGVHIRRYNQALIQAQNGNPDLAILQLGRVVEHKPNFVKAHMLLALLCIGQENYAKAGKSLYKVLQIDKNNPKALWYMSIVKSHTGRADVEKRRLKNAFSHHQMQDDDIILPPSYKENTGWQTVLHIAAGLALGAAVVFFLVMPAREEQLNDSHNREMTEVLEQMNRKSMEIEEMKAGLEAAEAERDSAAESLQAAEDAYGSVLGQYRQVARILQAYKADDFPAAVELYADLDPSAIEDGEMQAIAEEIRRDMEERGYQAMADLGNQARDAGNTEQALAYYQKSLDLKSDNPQVLYDMAMIYDGLGEEDAANDLFGQVILNYPDTELAAQAKAARGY